LCESKVCTTGCEFGCCAVCSTSGKLPHPIRPSLCESKVCTTGREFGCCAVCSTRKTDKFRLVGFSIIFALRRVILLRSDICLTTSVIRFASFLRRIKHLF